MPIDGLCKAGVGVAGYVQEILILSAGYPHTVLAGNGGAFGRPQNPQPSSMAAFAAVEEHEPGR